MDSAWIQLSSVPNSLPTGKEVCIKKIEERRRKRDELVKVCTIKVMCKAVSGTMGEANSDAKAN
jgi:hypothetical protein